MKLYQDPETIPLLAMGPKRSFVLSSEPAEEEGLLNYLHRLVALNGFRDMNIIHQLLGEGRFPRSWSHFSLALGRLDPEKLSMLTGVESSQLEFLNYKKYAKLVEFFGTAITPGYLSRIRRVSPSFLDNCGYQKAIWGMRCFSFDLNSMERLIDCCPHCGKTLAYRFSAGPCYCALCGGDLRAGPKEIVPISSPRAIDFLRYLVDPAPDADKSWDPPERLRCLSRSEIFATIVTLGNLLECEKLGGIDEAVLTRGEQFDLSHDTLIEATEAVLGWPDGFHSATEKVRSVKRHLVNRGHPLLPGIPRGMKSLKTFLKEEMGRSGSWKTRQHNFTSDRGKATRIHYLFPKSVEADVRALGLPRAEVLEIYRTGAAICPAPELRNELSAPGKSEGVHIVDFLERVPEGSDGVRLRDLVIASRSSRHPWAAVFDAVFKGDVRITQARCQPFARRFYTQDAVKLTEICVAANPQVDASTEISKIEAAFYLSTGTGMILSLRQAGLLPSEKLTLQDVWKFQDQFITTSEILSRMRAAGERTTIRDLWCRIDSVGLERAATGLGVLRRDEGEVFLSCAKDAAGS
ncbi:hypothetical protein [Rhizobium leguminosarum]|uniref:hypothetical protein n=2 Tax=Rhizobium leguminosarum TaxID=384 RepID=UPI001038D053|nr:hypothetical protein [Rhizobium leguminosarum]MBY5494710.1 hypothetical protein [Rhizobium leguminosarum]MBY5524681.1 hypothetical protein [Rhizobium leguminosarum]